MRDGILCMDKPKGFTSFDVIGKLRGILHFKKLGHAGTLDPMATGVLPVFVGKATKCCDILPNDDKSYIAEFKLGCATDTQDSSGNVVKSYPLRKVTRLDIENVIPQFVGNVQQIPPMYSAVSVNGKRLYELARQNIVIERPSREVVVYDIKVLSYDEDNLVGKLEISCGKGTYIRTIINDIGEVLNIGAYMTSLVRTSSGGFSLKDCFSFDDVEHAIQTNTIDSLIIPTERIFSHLPKIKLTENQTKMYKNGVKLTFEELSLQDVQDTYAMFSNEDIFLGIANADFQKNILRIGKNL